MPTDDLLASLGFVPQQQHTKSNLSALGEKMKTHQYGLTQKPTPRAKPYHYPLRELEGFSTEDVAMIQAKILDFFNLNL
ncbi:MAG: hypothetical protein H7Z73_06995 [Candidatus Saccharibacteria bacterium]|nr:hypothetical protein [Moraxellaceae bacterium]